MGSGARPKKRPRLTDEQKELASRYIPFAKKHGLKLCQKYPWIDYADCRGAAFIALCYAAQTYDPSKGATFGTWLQNKMRAATTQLLNDQKPAGMKAVPFKYHPKTIRITPSLLVYYVDRSNSARRAERIRRGEQTD